MDNEEFEVHVVSPGGSPTITFKFRGDTFRAELAGAEVHGERQQDDSLCIRLVDAEGECLADLTAHPRTHRTNTENAIDIVSPLLWAHWRWVEAQKAAA